MRIALLLLLLTGCATLERAPDPAPSVIREGIVTVIVAGSETIGSVCRGQAGCSTLVLRDGRPHAVTIWCHEGWAQCLAHETDHMVRQSSEHVEPSR